MNIKTVRDFQNAFILCTYLVEGKYGTNKMIGEGENAKMEFVPIVSKNSFLAYAAKRFLEKNQESIKNIEHEICDVEYKFALTDKETGETLRHKEEDKSPYKFRMTKENEKSYVEHTVKILNRQIDFPVYLHICPNEKITIEIPTEFYILNGLIFNHKFYEEFEPEENSVQSPCIQEESSLTIPESATT